MTVPELEEQLSNLLEEAADRGGLDLDEIISVLELAVIELKGQQGQEADEEGFATDQDDATDP